MQASNRIIVNTLVQYVRTIINTLLSLYSARLVLDVLGVSDYGIYALVAGVVSMLSFFTNSLVTSTQRFLSIAQGKGDLCELKKVFGNSLLLHIVIGLLVSVILAILTPFLFSGFLNIPAGRESVAIIIYLQVVLMIYISFVAAPYRALLVSRENIIYTSIIDVADGVLKVVLVIFLQYILSDKLEVYGWMMTGISVFNLLAFAIYCYLKYEECIYPHLNLFSISYLKVLFKYTGWVTYSTLSIVLRNQGLAIVLNRALDATINAAYGIGAQISGVVSFISASFTNAVSPQLTASEGGGDRVRMWKLASIGSKIPFLLLAMIGIPTMFEMRTLLSLWLVDVPEHTMLFGCTFLTMAIVDQMTAGLGMANRAIGDIGFYIFITCTPKLLILPLGWYVFYAGGNVTLVCIIMVFIEFLCVLMRIPPMIKMEGFDTFGFIKEVFIRTIPPVIVGSFICGIMIHVCDFNFRFLITFPLSITAFLITAYFFSLNVAERNKVNVMFNRVIDNIK